MSIYCGTCDDDGDWWYFPPEDFSKLDTKRSRKCWSCGDRIKVGEDCGRFIRERMPKHEVEERIYGEDGEVPMPTKFMCERCAGLFFALEDLGYCVSLPANMVEDAKEVALAAKDIGR